MDAQIVDLSVQLFELGCIKFGSFTLKSGKQSPIYVDLRLLPSGPTTLRAVAHAMASITAGLVFNRIAAIPLAGLPIGTALSFEINCPMIYPREAKQHGTQQTIEGKFEAGETVLLVDDVITRGNSKFEAIAPLENAGLKVTDVLVVIDREEGGSNELADRGYAPHSIMTLRQVISTLHDKGLIAEAQYTEVTAYFAESK